MTRPLLRFSDAVVGVGDVVADLDRLMEFGAFVEGTSRSGKTNLVRVFLEQTYGLVQHIVIDVEGEYATLRSAERPYLIVGNGRDVALPAEADAIRRFALAIVQKGVSVIFDLSEHDTDEQHTIVAAVCDALVSLPENHPGNAAVVLEELQEFAPEGGGKNTALPAVRRLSKRGLKRGFFIIGASQRVSDVSKGIVTQLKTKMIGGTDHKDAPRALEELGLPTRDRASVTDLVQGEFWVKGPAFERHAQHVRVPRSITAPPKRKRGEAPAPAAEAPAEIAALAQALQASVVKADPSPAPAANGRAHQEDAPRRSDEERRAARDAALQRARDEARHDEAQRHERYRQVLRAGAEQALNEARAARNLIIDQLDETIAGFETVVAGIDEQWIKPVAPDPRTTPVTSRNIVQQRVTSPALAVVADGKLSATSRRIIDALAFYAVVGDPSPKRELVAAFMGTSPGGTLSARLSEARKAGLIADVAAGRITLTAAGRANADLSRLPSSRRELQATWLAKVSGKAQELLRVLLDLEGESISRAALAAHVHMSIGGTFSARLSEVRRLGLLDESDGDVRASAMLFPEGLP